jgi:two-component system, OmpR family, osmolarity sensor histidine kinase EnvZ
MAPSFSIVRRLTVLTVTVSVLVLCTVGALMHATVDPLFDDLVETQAAQIATVKTALESAAPADRRTLAEHLTRDGLRVHRGTWWAEPPTPTRRPPDRVLASLRSRLGDKVGFGIGTMGETAQRNFLQASFVIDADRWFVELDLSRPSVPLVFSGVTVGLACMGIAFLVAIVAGIRLVTKPLARIAWQLAERQNRLRPLDIGQSFGTELHPLIQSFNELVRSVERADDARSGMLAGISHDLRTPLARLRLRADMECPPAAAEAMQPDFDAMNRIIGQFLVFAQAGGIVALGQPEPLAELVRHVESMYLAQGVRVEMDDARVAGFMYPDVSIQRMLTNLIDNALDHGRPPVVVQVTADDHECLLLVRDGGGGIPEASLAQALQPFVKLHPDRADLGHCGLGLAIVAQICAQLRGHVVRQSVEGGSALGVCLPKPGPAANGALARAPRILTSA